MRYRYRTGIEGKKHKNTSMELKGNFTDKFPNHSQILWDSICILLSHPWLTAVGNARVWRGFGALMRIYWWQKKELILWMNTGLWQGGAKFRFSVLWSTNRLWCVMLTTAGVNAA